MAKDDLTLQIGFEPDIASLQKAAEAGAKAYSEKFNKAIEQKLKLPTGYTRHFQPGNHLHNAQMLAADDFIKDSEVQKYTRIMKEAVLKSMDGLAKGFQRWSGQLVGQAYNGQSGWVNWVPGRYPTQNMTVPIGLPAPTGSAPLMLEHPSVIQGRQEWKDFIDDIRSTKAKRYVMEENRAKDISNLDVMRKGFKGTKTWSPNLYYNAGIEDEAGMTIAPEFYKLRAAQFIKDPNYRTQFGSLLQAYGGPEGFFNMPAASSFKYHPLFAHGQGGLVRHTEAVMQGVYQDAVKAGFSPKDTDKLLFAAGLHDAMKYQGGRPNATHASDMAFVLDQLGYSEEASWVRTHMGKVTKGYGKGEGPAAGNKYQKLIADTDFLVSRQYAQLAVDWRSGSMTPDMDKLRTMAVERGEGRWIDPKGPHTALNWERIVKDEKEVEKGSKDWLLNLRDVAGVLAVIHMLMKGIKAVKKFDATATAATAEAAANLPNRRYYAGFGVYEALRNQQAAEIAGLGLNAVNQDITNFSAQRGQMSLLGQGFDLLPASILGQFQNMMQSGDANSAWWNTLEAVAKRYDNASQKEREQLQTLLDKTLGKAATELLAYARNNNTSIEALRTLRENPNYSAYAEVEGINAEIKKLQKSISATYQTLYNDWEKLFGIPFRAWWDNFLKNTVPGITKTVNASVTQREITESLKEQGYSYGFGTGNHIITSSMRAKEDIYYSLTGKNIPVKYYRSIGGLDKAVYSAVNEKLDALGISGNYREEIVNDFLSPLLDTKKTETDVEARNFAYDLAEYLKTGVTDKAEINSWLENYFNNVLPTVRVLPFTNTNDQTILNRLNNPGELNINIYTEMKESGRLDITGITTDGGKDILSKVNAIPSRK